MLRPRLNTAALVLLLLVVAGALAPTLPVHIHSGEVLVPAHWREAHPGGHVISLSVSFDEEWRRTFGPDAEQQARRVVELSAEHLRPADIDLRVSVLTTWTSAGASDTLRGLLDALEPPSHPGSADIVLGLTAGRYSGDVDGVAQLRRGQVVVKHHPRRPARDAYVLTHEIGHLMGLDHHACPDGRCFMADHEYDLREHWCPEHLELLRVNAGYFDYIADGGSQA